MANTLTLGSIVISLSEGFSLEPVKLESNERALDGTLITNYAVSTGDVAVTKYRFNLSGIAQFPATFSGSTCSSGSIVALGSTYTVHLLSEQYDLLYETSTGANLAKYNLVLEEI